MKLSGKQPRLLPDVMQAIVDLKEGHGSTQNKILEHVQGFINAKKISPRPRNVTMQIRRALRHGIESGLLKQKAGKFVLGIHPKDFALYKSFQQMGSLSSCCNKCRRGRKGKRRGRRRRKRRHMGNFSDSDCSGKNDGSPEKDVYQSRRRRRRRRRGRRHKVSTVSGESSDEIPSNKTPRNSKELIRPQRSQRNFETQNISEPYGCEDSEKKPEGSSYIN